MVSLGRKGLVWEEGPPGAQRPRDFLICTPLSPILLADSDSIKVSSTL
jgi:hypothetical protein